MSKSKYRIQRKKAKLFTESEVSETFPWLKEKLTVNKEWPHLTTAEYNSLDDSNRRFIDTRFNELLEYAISEWVVEYDNIEKTDPEKIFNCELCGEKNIKFISKITNSKNQKKLLVGSSCITDYSQMRDSLGRTLGQIRKESNSVSNRILKNEEFLEKQIPGILHNIDSFNKIFQGNELLIRVDLEKYYETLNDKINKKYKKYLKQKQIEPQKVLEIECLNTEIISFLKAYNDYVEECKTDIYGITKEISVWCQSNCDYNLINKLKKDGKITIDTISSIKEPDFLSKVIPLFMDLFKKHNLKIKTNNIGINFKMAIYNSNIYFDVNSSYFIDEHKNYLYGDKENVTIDLNDIVKKCKITDKASLEAACRSIDFSKLKTMIFRFSDADINEISFLNRVDKKYYVVPFIEFINKFKENILFNKISYEHIQNYIMQNSTIYSNSDYNEHLKNYGLNLKDL